MSVSVSAPNQLLEHTGFMATDLDISLITYFRLVPAVGMMCFAEYLSYSKTRIIHTLLLLYHSFILMFCRHVTRTKPNGDHLLWCGKRKLIVHRGVGNWFSEVLVVQSSTQPILKLSTTIVHTKFNSETWLDSNSFSTQIAVWSCPETWILYLYSFVNLCMKLTSTLSVSPSLCLN